MPNTNRQTANGTALIRSLQARLEQCGGDEPRLVDALLMVLERHRIDGGGCNVASPDMLPDDTAVLVLARRVWQRDQDTMRRLAELEADEQPPYEGSPW